MKDRMVYFLNEARRWAWSSSPRVAGVALGMALLWSGCQTAEVQSRAEAAPPNFIVVLVDDQGWNGTSVEMVPGDSLSRSDYHETPHLEAFAAEGMRFSQAYAGAPVCAPSRYSVQFAKTPARLSLIRVGMNSDHIDHEGWWSPPRGLKALNANYVAAHFGKWGMGSVPEQVGYDVSDGPHQNRAGGFVNDRTQWDPSVKEDPKRINELTDKAIGFMRDQTEADRPFYLQVSHWAVHANLEATAERLAKYESKTPGAQQISPGFAAMTEDLDAGFGRLMDEVEALGLSDNTYVFYMSDNGSVPNIPGARKYDRSYNYPLSRGKWDAMEGGVRVPLMVRGPGIEANAHRSVPVSGVDLLPTILTLAGAESEFVSALDSIDGGSFAGVLQADEVEVQRPVEGLFFHVPYRNGIAFKRPHSAVRQGDFKLVLFQDDGEVRLYDLSTDIGEQVDLSEAMPEKANAMRSDLMAYLSSVRAPRWQEGITWKNDPIATFNSVH